MQFLYKASCLSVNTRTKKSPQNHSEASSTGKRLLALSAFREFYWKGCTDFVLLLDWPWPGSKSCSQARNVMGYFSQHWATAICKSWQQKSSHFTAALHSQKLGEFGLLLSTPALFKLMPHEQEQEQNLDSCEQSSSHVIRIIFLSGTSKVLMCSRKTESRKAASVYTHPHTEAPVMYLECPPQSTNPNIHNLPEVCAWERDLCGRTGHGELQRGETAHL